MNWQNRYTQQYDQELINTHKIPCKDRVKFKPIFNDGICDICDYHSYSENANKKCHNCIKFTLKKMKFKGWRGKIFFWETAYQTVCDNFLLWVLYLLFCILYMFFVALPLSKSGKTSIIFMVIFNFFWVPLFIHFMVMLYGKNPFEKAEAIMLAPINWWKEMYYLDQTITFSFTILIGIFIFVIFFTYNIFN